MVRFLCLNLSLSNYRIIRLVLVILWTCGLLLGAILSVSADFFLSSTVLSTVQGSLSIICFLSAQQLPLLFTAIDIYISQPFIILPVVFAKAVFYANVGIGLLRSFDVSGWLFCAFLMFSDSLILPILWWIWLQFCSEERQPVSRFIIFAAAGIIGIGCFDFFIVAPFWTQLV